MSDDKTPIGGPTLGQPRTNETLITEQSTSLANEAQRELTGVPVGGPFDREQTPSPAPLMPTTPVVRTAPAPRALQSRHPSMTETEAAWYWKVTWPLYLSHPDFIGPHLPSEDPDLDDLEPVSSLFRKPWWRGGLRQKWLAFIQKAAAKEAKARKTAAVQAAVTTGMDPEEYYEEPDISSLGKRWRPPPKIDRPLQGIMTRAAIARFKIALTCRRKLRKQYFTYRGNLLDNVDHKRKFAVGIRKGGVGKTTTTVLLSMVLYDVTGMVILDLDGNLESGHLAERAGVGVDDKGAKGSRKQRGSMAYHELYDLVNVKGKNEDGTDKVGITPSYADLRQMACSSELNHLLVIASDTPQNVDDHFTLDGCTKVQQALTPTCDWMFTDLGTGLSSFMVRSAILEADNLIVPCLLDEEFGLKDLKTTKETFAKLKDEGLSDKLDRMQVALIGAKKKDLEKLYKYYGVRHNQMYPIDRNRYVHSKRPLDPRRLPLRLYVQLLHILNDAIVPELPKDAEFMRS